MPTKQRKSRKSSKRSRKSCKYGKLKRPVKTKSGRKRRCKKSKSRRKSRGRKKSKSRRKKKRTYKIVSDSDDEWDDVDMSGPPSPRGITVNMSEFVQQQSQPRVLPSNMFNQEYVSDGSVDGEFDSDEEWENRDWETLPPLRPVVKGSRCVDGCVGKEDSITLEPIKMEDNAVVLDKQCYNSNSLRKALMYDSRLPHNRSKFTIDDLNRILMRENINECL